MDIVRRKLMLVKAKCEAIDMKMILTNFHLAMS